MQTEIDRNCIHSRQVQALFDGKTKGKFLTEHVSSCPVCLKKYEFIKKEEEALSMAIPFQTLPEDMKNSLQLDIVGVTDALDRYVRELKGRSRKKTISFFKMAVRDIIHSVSRPLPLTSLAIATGALILKIYF